MHLKNNPYNSGYGGNDNFGGNSSGGNNDSYDGGSSPDDSFSYYESAESSGTFDNTSYGDPNYYGDNSFSQNPYNQYSTDQPVNPYQQYGYGRTDLGDGFYDEPAGSASVDMMNPLMKTAGMAAGVGGMMDSISNTGGSAGFGNDDSSYSRSHHNSYHHRHHYHRGYGYGTRNGAAGVVSAALINEVLVNAYLYMFIALLITGITALIVASSSIFNVMFAPETFRVSLIVILVLEFGLVIACTTAMQRDNFWLSAFLFAAFAIVNGLTFSVIFLAFTISSICQVFFITSLIFGIMSMYGAITKKDLTGWGPILFAGLIGIIVGSLINFFVGSTMADYVITIIGIVVFMAYTAYDVNKITKMSRMNTGLSAGVLGMYGAMELYLDFINLFIRLLRLMGKRK